MQNDTWKVYERCANLMADYKGQFGKNVPLEIMFYDMETISNIVEMALKNNKEIEVDKK